MKDFPMPYTVNWYIKNEVVYTHYTGVVTINELRACLLEMKKMIESSPRNQVHAISDVGDIIEPVAFKDSIGIVREVGHHPRAGWTISIREKSLIVKMGSALGSSIFKLRFRSFTTLDQAIAHLKFIDEALSWDKVEKLPHLEANSRD
jgi:hypothetical protein